MAIRAANGDLHAAGCYSLEADTYHVPATCNEWGVVAAGNIFILEDNQVHNE